MPKLKTPGRAASAQRDDVKDWSKRMRRAIPKLYGSPLDRQIAIGILDDLDEFLASAAARANKKAGGKGRK